MLIPAGFGSAPAAAYPRPGATERVSVASDGAETNSGSSWPTISADGRFAAFHSGATNLVPGDTNGEDDVFVRDRGTGATERVSVASDGTQGTCPNKNACVSSYAALSADGRFVAFRSFAVNLVPGDTNGRGDIFVHDRAAGVTSRVSVASDSTQSNRGSSFPAISADGRFVAFVSMATNLVPGDTNDWSQANNADAGNDVFVHDRQSGVTERVSVASDGTEGDLPFDYSVPSLSADGRFVAFSSQATNLVPGDANGQDDVFVHDRDSETTERVSVASDGTEGNFRSDWQAISADGRFVAFSSLATNLVPSDTNHCPDAGGSTQEFIRHLPPGTCDDVFVHDRETGVTERVSLGWDGAEGNGASATADISADGRFVTFSSAASNLVPGDSNGVVDAFVHDRLTGTTERVSIPGAGGEVDDSGDAAISDDGRFVSFMGQGSNLVPDDTNAKTDIFVRDRGPAVGVGHLTTQLAGDELTAAGWATFPGAAITSSADPANDGGAGPIEILQSSITLRPEQEDLLLRLRLASLPGPLVGEAPGVVYRWDLTVGGTAYEVRASLVAATGSSAETFSALYRCYPQRPLVGATAACTLVTKLSGGIGAAGPEVVVSVPLESLQAGEGTSLSRLRASAHLEDGATAVTVDMVPLDEVALPAAVIPASSVDLGIAPPEAPEGEIAFETEAGLVDGSFAGTLDISTLPPGDYRVWAKACIDHICGARSVDVTL